MDIKVVSKQTLSTSEPHSSLRFLFNISSEHFRTPFKCKFSKHLEHLQGGFRVLIQCFIDHVFTVKSPISLALSISFVFAIAFCGFLFQPFNPLVLCQCLSGAVFQSTIQYLWGFSSTCQQDFFRTPQNSLQMQVFKTSWTSSERLRSSNSMLYRPCVLSKIFNFTCPLNQFRICYCVLWISLSNIVHLSSVNVYLGQFFNPQFNICEVSAFCGFLFQTFISLALCQYSFHLPSFKVSQAVFPSKFLYLLLLFVDSSFKHSFHLSSVNVHFTCPLSTFLKQFFHPHIKFATAFRGFLFQTFSSLALFQRFPGAIFGCTFLYLLLLSVVYLSYLVLSKSTAVRGLKFLWGIAYSVDFSFVYLPPYSFDTSLQPPI